MSDRLSGTFTATTTRLSSGALKVIDVSEKPAQANVVREGKLVPAVTTNATALQNWVNVGVIRPVEDLRRVVSQTIPAGTRVTRGTTVDILMAEPRLIPLDVLEPLRVRRRSGLLGHDLPLTQRHVRAPAAPLRDRRASA